MKNWIFKFVAALGMTIIIALLLLAGYTGMSYILKEPISPISYAILLGLFAIYIYCHDYVDRM